MKNIIIYGMRGTGKSSIGKKISQMLKLPFYDLDNEIEKATGEKIYIFIEKFGWDIFRKKESEVLKKIINKDEKKVLSLGGGTMIFKNNSDFLLKNSDKLIFIDSDLDQIIKRVVVDEEKGNQRNALTNKGAIEELKDIYKIRKPIYESFYDIKVNNNTDLDSCVNEILEKIKIGGICIPITNFEENSLKANIDLINNTREIKFVELRIDFIEDEKFNNIFDIIKTIKKQVIITNRNSLEGGNFKGTFSESVKKIEKFIDYGVYFDIELLAGDEIFNLKNNFKNKKLIISYHNFDKTPDLNYLIDKIKQMEVYQPDVYKIALIPNNSEDLQKIYDLQKYFESNYKEKDYIFISMGEIGIETRINIPKNGGLLTFGILDKSSAPGQINYKDLYKNLIG